MDAPMPSAAHGSGLGTVSGFVGQQDGNQLAPWLLIPSRAISVVEHPCIIKNVDKAITSLGGALKLSKQLRAKPVPDPEAENGEQLPELITASLRPDDPFAKRLLATSVTTNNLLLKVTVPKRTGRRRKRGSSGPFVADDETVSNSSKVAATHVSASEVFRSLQDNANQYTVTPVGVIDESHRFRDLPDIQYASGQDEIMANVRKHLLPLRYSQLKNFNISTAAGANLTKNVGPSAEFIQMPVAYNYKFQQNSFVKYTGDGRQEVNTQRSMALYGCIVVKPDAESIPTGPKWDLPVEDSLTPYMQSLVANIRDQLQQRPIITRHYLFNTLGWDKRDRLRDAAIYCGFFFESGPWREALVAWGVDPREDPTFRKYQTISFLSYKSTGVAKRHQFFDDHARKLAKMSPEKLKSQHIFDGIHISDTGNMFQFCDITDSIIRKILDTEDIRTVCAPTFQGWYHVGTWAKATVILKDKINRIITGETPDPSLYERILAWPEKWEDKEMYSTYKSEVMNPEVHKEKAKEHEVMHTVRWAAKNPRWAFKKLERTMEQGSAGEEREKLVADEEVPDDATEIPETADAIFNEGGLGIATQVEIYGAEAEDMIDGDDEDGIWEADDSESDGPVITEMRDGKPRPFGGLYHDSRESS